MIGDSSTALRSRPLYEWGDIYGALDRLPVPVFAIDRSMAIRWLNRASQRLIGDREGEQFTELLDAGSVPAAREAYAQKLVGSVPSTEYEVTLRTRDGSLVRAEISSVAVRGGDQIVGVFGMAAVDNRTPPARSGDGEISLTPRQAQVLHLLARGCSTEQMADELGVAQDTIRNHVRALLRRLGVHSRLEAVIEAGRRELV